MTSPIIERAARAIDPEAFERADADAINGPHFDARRREAVETARAVLRAIREHPSHAMLSAGGEAVYDQSGDTSVIEIWQAMIDAALGEE